MLPFLLIGAVFAIFVALAIVSYRRNQQRLATIASLCLSKGWQFLAGDPFGLPMRWPGPPFDQGYDRHAFDVVTGEVGGHPMVAFDYEYKTDSTDSEGRRTTTTHRYAVCALGMPCVLPELSVAPEGVFSRIGQALGMQDIELESEAFNRAYKVRCPDRKLATDVLTPRTMELLLRGEKMRFRFSGTDVVSWHDGQLQPADLLNRTAILAGVIDGVPSFVWKDRGLSDPPVPPSPQPSPGSLT
ncbi:MAG TPA: DUF3137 domain-containing protein [Mycobacteriales bacterium]|jgi:hypothetical protein|nr:DUF3137 domain-containing protein [Mycobacteriales bacterium]